MITFALIYMASLALVSGIVYLYDRAVWKQSKLERRLAQSQVQITLYWHDKDGLPT